MAHGQLWYGGFWKPINDVHISWCVQYQAEDVMDADTGWSCDTSCDEEDYLSLE